MSMEIASNQSIQDSIQPDSTGHKNNIKSHPLFPLLALAFEKCELATCTTRFSGIDICSPQSFVNDIKAFSIKIKEQSSIFTTNAQVDSLILQAIQVLQIHLLELEKVHLLCNNFCKRYISSLEGKMPLDVVLEREDREGKNSISEKISSQMPKILSDCQTLKETALTNGRPSSLQKYPEIAQTREETTQSINLASCAFSRKNEYEGCSPTSSETNADSVESFVGPDDDDNERPKQKKRGIFPKMATNIMKAWLFQHLAHPYPSEDQKRILANDTGLTILQVNNWFINARRRIVQPMIDASSRSGKTPVITVFKSRKRKLSSPQGLHSNSYYQNNHGHFQQASPYHHDYYYPSNHSAYPTDGNINSNQYLNNSYTSCQYVPAYPGDTTSTVSPLSSCMEARPQHVQTQFDNHHIQSYHHTSVSQLYSSCPTYSSENNQIQNGQFFVKAS
eukprot:gene20299-22288_t